MKSSICIILLTAFLFSFAGCSSSPESQLVGKWVGKTGSFVFLKDKSGFLNPPAERTDLPRDVRYKWSIEGSDTVRMDMGPPVLKPVYGRLESKKVLIIEDDRFMKQ